MSDPAAQPRRLFLALLVLVALVALVSLLIKGLLILAVVVGLLAVVLLVAGARPTGSRHS